MFRALLGSAAGRITSLLLLIAGMVGGMVATGGMPGFLALPFGGSGMLDPAPGAPTVLDFPLSDLAREGIPAAAPAPAPVPVPAVEEEIVEVVMTQAPPAAALASPPACVAQLEKAVNGLLGALPSIATAEQGQDLLGRAVSVARTAPPCVAQSRAAGNLGMERLTGVGEALASLVAQATSLPVMAPAEAPVAGPLSPLTPVTDLAGKGIGAALGGLNKVTGFVGEGLGLLIN